MSDTDEGLELWHRFGAQGISWSAAAIRVGPFTEPMLRALLALNRLTLVSPRDDGGGPWLSCSGGRSD